MIPNSTLHIYPAEQFLIEKKHKGIFEKQIHGFKEYYLRKYCPKYYQYLQLDAHYGSKQISSLKRIKKITKVQDYFPTRVKIENQWRVILQNKFKSIESYHDNSNINPLSTQKKSFLFLLNFIFYASGPNISILRSQKLQMKIFVLQCLVNSRQDDINFLAKNRSAIVKKKNVKKLKILKITVSTRC